MQSHPLRLSVRVLVTALAAAIVLLGFERPATAADWQPCIDAIDDISCTRLKLPIDRTGLVTGETTVQVYKAGATEGPRLGTLVVIAGGPGQSSLGMLDFMLALFSGANRYDLVAIDQRGTGLSEPLNCPLIERGVQIGGADPSRDRVVSECADALGAPRWGYDTAESVADIEAVRAELGVDKISLFGVSYGSKLAMAYAKSHPTHVRSLLLDSVLPVGEPGPFDIASVAAMRGSLDQICANGRCRGVLRTPQASLRQMIARLGREPLVGFLENEEGKSPERVLVGPTQILELLFAADFNLYVYEQLPAAIDAALRGNDVPLLRLFAVLNTVEGGAASRVKTRHDRADERSRAQSRPHRHSHRDVARPRSPAVGRIESEVSEFSNTLNLTTSCEDLATPWARGAQLGARQSAIDAAAAVIPDDAFLPFDRETVKNNSLASTCRGWPESSDAPTLPDGPLPAVPTLALNGTLDVRTPAAWARQAIDGNPVAELATIPYTGHSTIGTDTSGCALSLAKRFLIFSATDGKCKRNPQRLPVAGRALTSLAQLKPLRGTCRGARGRRCRMAKRAITAGYLAFRDALDQLVIGGMVEGPGLYGGDWELSADFDLEDMFSDEIPFAIALHGMQQVPGALTVGRVYITDYPRISGSFTVFGPGGGYRVQLSGRVAYDLRNDRVRLTARKRRVRVALARGGRRSAAGWTRASAAALRARTAFSRAAGTWRVAR